MIRSIAPLLLLCLFSATAMAAEPAVPATANTAAAAAETTPQDSACQKDIAALCVGESKASVTNCLKGNESKLSAECKAYQMKARAAGASKEKSGK